MIPSDFLPIFDMAFYLSAFAVFIAGMVKGFAGFGSALIMVPCIAMVYSPITAIMAEIVIDAIGGLQMLPMAFKDSDRKTVIPLVISALFGIPTGALILLSLEPGIIKQVMAIAIFLFVGLLFFGWRAKGEQTFNKKLGVGFMAGILGGSTGFSGPPIILYLMSSGQSPQKLRASITLFFTFSTIVSIITFSIAGEFDVKRISLGLLLTPFCMLGIYAGSKLFHLATEKIFRNIALIILTVVSITTLMDI